MYHLKSNGIIEFPRNTNRDKLIVQICLIYEIVQSGVKAFLPCIYDFSGGPRDPALQTFYRNLSQVVNVLSLPEPGGRFQLLQVIGEGTYGEVYAAHDTATGTASLKGLLITLVTNIIPASIQTLETKLILKQRLQILQERIVRSIRLENVHLK